jgi:hypothetical protein
MSKSVLEALATKDDTNVDFSLTASEEVILWPRHFPHYHGYHNSECHQTDWSESCLIEHIVTPVVFDEDPEEKSQDEDTFLSIEQEISDRNAFQSLGFEFSQNTQTYSKCKLWYHWLVFMILVAISGSGIIYMIQYNHSNVENCDLSSSSLLWKPKRVLPIGILNHVTMNGEFLVGIKGETILETHNVQSGEIQVQYVDTTVQSMFLTNTGILLSQQAPLLSLRILDDNSIWRDAQNFMVNASSIADTNGEYIVIWSNRNITFYNHDSQEMIASIKNVEALKLSENGDFLFVATTQDLLCFHRDMRDWKLQNSIRFSSDPEFQVSDYFMQLNVQTSSDGSLVALWSSSGAIQFYFFHQHGKVEKLLTDSKMNATHVAISQQPGFVVAIATQGREIWILEKVNDIMKLMSQVSSRSVRLLTFSKEQLHVLDSETLTIYESKCDTNFQT